MNIGILGAGQLSRMLIQAGRGFAEEGLDFTVLTTDTDESVRDLGVEIRQLENLTPQHLSQKLKGLNFLTFENEFTNVSPLRAMPFLKIFPSLDVIETLQDKIQQKRLLDRLKLPTPKWQIFKASHQPEFPIVFKWAKQGYDGKGTLLARNAKTPWREFIDRAEQKNVEIYTEDFVDFDREVALVSARNWSGDIVFFPLVETHQLNGICHDVLGGTDLLREYEEPAQQLAVKILEELNYVGVLAIEFFVDRAGQLLVNELAPRVHNSAHFTQLACNISQFEAHLRAGLDWSLERPKAKVPFYGMWNIIPSVAVDRDYSEDLLPSLDPQYELVWYQKSRLRTGRKMGHINFAAQDWASFEKMREQLKKWERNWNESLVE